MSHFIMSSNSTFILGTPNGQARTQLLHAMQRGLRAVCTTPSSLRLMASAGHTSAQVGESQCMHTVGTVWVAWARSMRSRWIIGRPLWVSHSPQACTHASQPMQRLGSTNMERGSAVMFSTLVRRELLDLARPLRQPFHAHGAHLVLGDLGDGILGGDGEPVRAALARPMVGNEHRVR